MEHKHVYGKVEKRQELLVRLWVLADRLDIPRLQNLVVDELESIRRTWDDSVAWHCLAYVYENTVEDCCLRELLLLHCRCFLPREVLREHADDIPKAFLVEYALGKEHDWVDWTDRQDFRRRFHVPVMEEGIEDGFYGEKDDTDEEDKALDGSANYDTGFTDGTDGFGGDWGDSLQAEEHSN